MQNSYSSYKINEEERKEEITSSKRGKRGNVMDKSI